MLNISKNKTFKNILSALTVAFFGFFLLNLTFIFDAFYQNAIRGIIALSINLGPDTQLYWFPPLMHISFVVIIGIISWFIFKSKLKTSYKATFMIVPLAVVLVTIGMFFYRWPIAVYSLGCLFSLGILYYLYHTKQPWLYYFTLILISFIMLMVGVFNVEI